MTLPVTLMVVQAVVLLVIVISAVIACRRASTPLRTSSPVTVAESSSSLYSPSSTVAFIGVSQTTQLRAQPQQHQNVANDARLAAGRCLLDSRIVLRQTVWRHCVGRGGICLQQGRALGSRVEKVDEVEPLSFGDLQSAGNCHPECDGGCSESQSAVACFRCKHFTQTLRNKAGNGFKCVSHCDDTYYMDGANCKMCSKHCHTCSQAEVCETCPGAQLLVHVEHSPQNGKCVEKCPEGQVPDYETNLVQARCVLRAERCGVGYYLNGIGKCDQCDQACTTCNGPGSLGCEICASGYGNRSSGYCRPCCGTQHATESYRCEDCSPNAKYPARGHRNLSLFWSFVWVALFVGLMSFIGLLVYCIFKDDGNQIGYTPLPHYNSQTGEVHILDTDSDEEDEIYEMKQIEI